MYTGGINVVLEMRLDAREAAVWGQLDRAIASLGGEPVVVAAMAAGASACAADATAPVPPADDECDAQGAGDESPTSPSGL